ncbi:MAG TPA: chorismate synthase [Planctomycetaceae bacterium]|nr:chorismate synthase [Planctomycetaceae bacterium]
MPVQFRTAGESHGRGLLALIEGFPAGIAIDKSVIDKDLARRQGGYGRGARQAIERDRVEILTGIWQNRSTGAPISLWVNNNDCRIDDMPILTRPRPGHADLSGTMKYGQGIRPILERSSARETAARVAAGGLVRQLLAQKGIIAAGYVLSIGKTDLTLDGSAGLSIEEVLERREKSELYTLTPEWDERGKSEIDQARRDGDALGGIIEVRVDGLPFGVGSHVQWDRKLDGLIAQAVMSVQAIKGVEIGLGFESARRRGSDVHDPIMYDPKREKTPHRGFLRPTNHAGGIEGGISNSEPIIVRAAMKPIPTMIRSLPSVDLETHEPVEAAYERSDVCAVSAASVVVEAAVLLAIGGCEA